MRNSLTIRDNLPRVEDIDVMNEKNSTGRNEHHGSDSGTDTQRNALLNAPLNTLCHYNATK